MRKGDYMVDPQRLDLDPHDTICGCGSSVVLPPFPAVHCVKCHTSYTARGLQRPAYCAHCGYNLRAWRLRNRIPDLVVQFA